MLAKKLVTLVCAAGILACGACFLPPLPQHPPPPPPRKLDLQGIQSIRVEVTNASEFHHHDPSDLAQAVANAINWRTRETGVNAHIQKEAGDGDAVLAITVLSETATPETTPESDGSTRWSFIVETSATLTKLNGQRVWHETEVNFRVNRSFAQQDPALLWKEPTLAPWLSGALSQRVVYRMLYAH